MSVHPLPVRPQVGSVFESPDDLSAALRLPFSDQQLTAITAPLEPGVIIAGAGSGKTTVMAARVVWLVGTGAVRPEEVLGLTFTRKAAAELSQRVRTALDRAGVVPAEGIDAAGEQLVMTYDAFAARLVAEHGLRLGYETDPTMITGATRYRLASRVVREAAGPFEHISRLRPAASPSGCCGWTPTCSSTWSLWTGWTRTPMHTSGRSPGPRSTATATPTPT